MDRLPFELLVHIVEWIALEPLPQLRQGPLAKLSRTKKTLFSATQPILYRDPVLLSDWRAECYEKTIGKKVDPWLLSQSRRKEKRWWMPKKLSFRFPCPPREAEVIPLPGDFYPRLRFVTPLQRLCPQFLSCPSDVVWSNLTSLSFRNCHTCQEFLAEILAPRCSSRRTIISLRCFSTYADLTLFLFEGAHFVKSIEKLMVYCIKTGVEYPSDEASSELEEWERHKGGWRDQDAWSYEPLSEASREKARFDFELWQDTFDQEPLWEIENATLATIIDSSRPSEYPFSALSSLTLRFYLEVEYHLIFYTSLFPSLRVLVLQSKEAFRTIESLDQATLRYSVTR